jgi:L-asparagine oxygenase
MRLATVETITLSEVERDVVAGLVAGWEPIDPVADPGEFVRRTRSLSGGLPERLKDTLLPLRTDDSCRGGLLVRGVPIGHVPPTPERADRCVGAYLDAARAMSVIVGMLGEQFGFRQELSGQIIQDVLPVPGFEDAQQAISSRALLNLHTESAFTSARADLVALLCLRADAEGQAATLISPACDVLPRLTQETIQILRQPRFATRVDASFLRGAGLTETMNVNQGPILSGSRDRPRLRADFAEISGLDSGAQHAIEDLHHAASAAARAVHLRPGDLLVVDNHTAFHGRTPFTMTRDGQDRWLLRTLIARNLVHTGTSRPSHGPIIDLDLSALAQTG